MRRDKLIKTALKRSYERNREDYLVRERHQDSIILWIVGLSSATIIILLSNNIPRPSSNFTIILYSFLTAIIAGVLFRIARYYLEELELNALDYGIQYLETEMLGVTAPIDVNRAPAEVIQRSLKELGYDLSGLIKNDMPIEQLRQIYDKFAESYHAEEEKGIIDIYRFLETFEGKKNPHEGSSTDELLKNMSKATIRKTFRFVKNTLYMFTTLSFIVAVILGVTSFGQSLKSTDTLNSNESYQEVDRGKSSETNIKGLKTK